MIKDFPKSSLSNDFEKKASNSEDYRDKCIQRSLDWSFFCPCTILQSLKLTGINFNPCHKGTRALLSIPLSKTGVKNDIFWSETGSSVRIWRTGRYTHTKNSQKYRPPGSFWHNMERQMKQNTEDFSNNNNY